MASGTSDPEPAVGAERSWLDEIDLDPDAGWLAMKTRSLGQRPWLVPDDRRGDELALKARLLATRPAEVFAARPGSDRAGQETLEVIETECRRLGLDSAPISELATGQDRLHPLDRAGRLVQEDLCLLAPGTEGWTLEAASLCFPSRWRLADKLGRSQAEVHGPVAGYRTELAGRVDRLFDRIGERIVWRRNWFIHPDPALFQPDRPPNGDPVVTADRCASGLTLRSERQTLRRLTGSGWILFTIRTQQEPLGRLLADPGRRQRFARYLADAPEEQLAHRGLGHQQVAILRTTLR